jgi:hypothetical protein
MKSFAIDSLANKTTDLFKVEKPKSLSAASLYFYKVDYNDGLPNYTDFKDETALKALDELCQWFENLDKNGNIDQIEKIAKAISNYVQGPGMVYNFFVKIIHHEPTRKRLAETGIIQHISDNPRLIEPLMGMQNGEKKPKAANLFSLKAVQELFKLDENGISTIFHDARDHFSAEDKSQDEAKERQSVKSTPTPNSSPSPSHSEVKKELPIKKSSMKKNMGGCEVM